MWIICLFLISWVNLSTPSIITSSPGLQRKHIGDNCEFQWTMTGDDTRYVILNLSTGNPLDLFVDHANHSLTSSGGVHVIRLFISAINLWDAGNYSLSVTSGTTKIIDAGALLFVYGNVGSSSITSNVTLPATEGTAIALSCQVTTNSLPTILSYQPRMYYIWNLSNRGTTKIISSGHPVLESGEVLTRYYTEDDGRTLVIDSLQLSDKQSYNCYGREEGSRYRANHQTNRLVLSLNFQPKISDWKPLSRKFNTDIGHVVAFGFSYTAYPSVSALPTWTLINLEGTSHALPSEFLPLTLTNPFSVRFAFLSSAYYGQYTFHISNPVGATNGSFSVLPPGPPDPPSNLKVVYKTFRLIFIEWQCMWFNGRQQTSMLQFKDIANNAILETFNSTEADNNCFNQSRYHLFQNDLQSGREYEVSVWYNNSLGSSDAIKLSVRTTKRFQLILSQKTISINGSEATVHFETTDGNIALLRVLCCVEEIGPDLCSSRDFTVNASSSEVIVRGLPTGMVYLFDFTASGIAPGGQRYFLGMIKGVRVHRDGNPRDPPLTSVIVLGSLFAVALIALFVCLCVFLFVKTRGRRSEEDRELDVLEKSSKPIEMKTKTEEKPSKAKEQQRVQQRVPKDPQRIENKPVPGAKAAQRRTQPQPPKMPSPDEKEDNQETYEAPNRDDEENEGEMYTPLDQPPPPQKNKRNLYS